MTKKEMNSTALLLVDIQNDFCADGGAFDKLGRNVKHMQGVMPQIHHLIDFARGNQIIPFFIKTVQNSFTKSANWTKRDLMRSKNPVGICDTEWGNSFYEIEPRDDEPVVIKHRYSAFLDTNLHLLLRSRNIQNVIVTGFTSNVCVEGTARDAFMRDYHVVTLSDCCAAPTQEEHDSAMHNLKTYFGQVLSLSELKQGY